MLYQTNNYVLDTYATSKQLRYSVTNKETGVVEYKDRILPRCLDAMNNLQELFDKALASHNQDTGDLTVISFNRDDTTIQ